MNMEINARWLFLVSIAWLTGLTDVADDTGAFKLRCGPSVTAEVGDTVTLQCLLEPQRDVSEERVEWMRVNDEVHWRRDGKDNFTDQMPAYKNRTSLGLSKGDYSLKLSNVNESDSGTYKCSVKIKGIEEKECSTNLTVHPRGEKTSSGGDTDTSQLSTGAIAGIITAAIGGIGLFAVLWLIFRKRCAGQDGGRPQEAHELASVAVNIPPDPHEGQDGGQPGEEDERAPMCVQEAPGSNEKE